jgi:hypothetical protein
VFETKLFLAKTSQQRKHTMRKVSSFPKCIAILNPTFFCSQFVTPRDEGFLALINKTEYRIYARFHFQHGSFFASQALLVALPV